MSQKRFSKKTSLAKCFEKRLNGRPRTRWRDYIKDLGWSRLALRACKMQFVLVDGEMRQLNLELHAAAPATLKKKTVNKKKFTLF